MTFSQAEAVIRQAYETAEQSLGTPPSVYARFSGSTPSDMTGPLVRLGYCGLIPLDFAGGTKHTRKVVVSYCIVWADRNRPSEAFNRLIQLTSVTL